MFSLVLEVFVLELDVVSFFVFDFVDGLLYTFFVIDYVDDLLSTYIVFDSVDGLLLDCLLKASLCAFCLASDSILSSSASWAN